MVQKRMEPLLPLGDKQPLSSFWFPTPAQCFIYRNWEMVTPERLAAVLDTSVDTVTEMAAALGLGPATSECLQKKWLDNGYVTLIRANWHLLPYDQLQTLLGWEEQKLAFILQHDDFLGIKLGRAKPDCERLAVTPLTPEGKEKTEKIAAITRQLRETLGPRAAEPFTFTDFFPTKDALGEIPGESALKDCLLLPYNALYLNAFDEEYFEYSYPDSLLEAYASLGITAFSAQAVLYNLVPFALAPELAEGCEERLESIRRLIQRLKRHGLKLYLYINEPRDLPDVFFENIPHCKGDVHTPGRSSVCLSVPEVQDAYRQAIYDLVKALPGLGGFVLITASENQTNCYSRKKNGETLCPRCRTRTRAELFAQAVSLTTEGAHAADPNIKIIASAWAWDGYCETAEAAEAALEAVLSRLPKDTAIWYVSERKAVKNVGGVRCVVGDYSISIPGPGEYALMLCGLAKKYNLPTAVKLQMNNSWELSSVPYIPVFHHFYQAIRDMREKVEPDMAQLTWTQGGFPSPVLRMFSEMTRKGQPIPPEEELVKKLYPGADFPLLLQAFDCFDKAFDNFPFSVSTMYNGPQHMGPSLPLYPEKTGYEACMCGPSYDDLRHWNGRYFPDDVFEEQFRLMAVGFKEGIEILKKALEPIQTRPDAKLLMDCAEGCYLHFASSYNHIVYVGRRGTGEDMTALIQEEEALAVQEAALAQRNPTIGFEATNHYYFTVTDLYEKVLNCRALLGQL